MTNVCITSQPLRSSRRRWLMVLGGRTAGLSALPGAALALAANPLLAQKEKPRMNTARQALEAALKTSAGQLNQRPIINIVVDPGEKQYTVRLSLLAPVSQPTSECLTVAVDSDTGVARPASSAACPNPLLELQPEWQHSAVLDGRHAYQAALQAIKGYEHYDAYGRLEIRLKHDRYEVTFPDPAARLQGGHTADYTYQVWLNARTGAVLKILAAS